MPTVGILGAGTMGSGIAQVAAAAGWNVQLLDVDPAAVERALEGVRRQFDRLVEKGRMSPAERDAAGSRLAAAADARSLRDCDLVIEAVIEDLSTKVAALRGVADHARDDAIFASNTSSLSISRIGDELGRAHRTVGMHFFNPVPLMPLVEIIAGRASQAAAVQRATSIAREWGRTPVQVRDTPGFIVNRVARGYYLEPLRMFEEGIAGVDEIDRVLKLLGGFRMGPFELMDLIGIDVNYSVSVSVWEQLGRPARLQPSGIQRTLFERRQFGRKSKLGMYSYQSDPPLPALVVERRSFDISGPLYAGVRRFCDGAAAPHAGITEQYVFGRTLAAIINEAGLALDEGVASQADIDTAMKLGTNYPKGPLEWAEQIGRHTCAALLRALNKVAGDGRFEPARWLA